MTFPPLPTDWEPTRARLHAHTAIAGVVARSHAVAHPSWWHVSLTVTERGLVTDPIPLPDGRSAAVVVDPTAHVLRLEVGGDSVVAFPLTDPPTAVAHHLFAALSDLGLDDSYDQSRLHDDPAGEYDIDHAEAFWEALTAVHAALQGRRAARPGETSPVQVWPHGFDVSFEWFGSRVVEHDEDGQTSSMAAQLNLGWYPGGDAYFYSNPWPFDGGLVEQPLPQPATWHTDGWNGTMLVYADVLADPKGSTTFAEYADAVFDLVRTTLEV